MFTFLSFNFLHLSALCLDHVSSCCCCCCCCGCYCCTAKTYRSAHIVDATCASQQYQSKHNVRTRSVGLCKWLSTPHFYYINKLLNYILLMLMYIICSLYCIVSLLSLLLWFFLRFFFMFLVIVVAFAVATSPNTKRSRGENYQKLQFNLTGQRLWGSPFSSYINIFIYTYYTTV